MTLVSVTRTGNESDIIEPFVRHHAAIFDRLLIIDDDSTDGTADILRKLQREGLPLHIFKASEVDWDQRSFVTRLMHIAFDEHGATWVAPLDVDEFIELPEGSTLPELLPKASKLLVQLRWSNFVWQRKLAGRLGNPVTQLRLRMPPRTDSHKALVPREAIDGDPTAYVLAGNHGVVSHGDYVNLVHIPAIALCHYPIRSIDQFVSKCVINYLRYVESPGGLGGKGTPGFQYRVPVEVIKNNPVGIPMLMEKASKAYALQGDARIEGDPTTQPLRYLGGPLRHTNYRVGSLPNIIRHAEALAHRIAELDAAHRG